MILAVVGCDSSSSRRMEAVATVNGEAITAGAFEEALALRRANFSEELAETPEVGKALQKRVLEELITRRLLLQEAARRGLSSSAEAVGQRLKALAEGYTPAEYEALLEERGLSMEAFRARLAEDIMIEMLLNEALGAGETPGPEVVKAYYQDHRGEFHRPIRARTLHLVVASKEEAGRLRKEALAGSDFAEMARRHSLGPEAAQEGDLGWVSPGQMPEVFDEAIFALKPGEVSPVVASPYGYHLFKLVEVEPAGLPTLEEARSEIIARLGAEVREERYGQWVAGLRERATVVVKSTGEEVSK